QNKLDVLADPDLGIGPVDEQSELTGDEVQPVREDERLERRPVEGEADPLGVQARDLVTARPSPRQEVADDRRAEVPAPALACSIRVEVQQVEERETARFG